MPRLDSVLLFERVLPGISTLPVSTLSEYIMPLADGTPPNILSTIKPLNHIAAEPPNGSEHCGRIGRLKMGYFPLRPFVRCSNPGIVHPTRDSPANRL